MTSDELIPLALGALLLRLRIERKMTQAELAKRAGHTQSHVSRMEAGRRVSLDISDLYSYARVLRTTPFKLLKSAEQVVGIAQRTSAAFKDVVAAAEDLVPIIAKGIVITP